MMNRSTICLATILVLAACGGDPGGTGGGGGGGGGGGNGGGGGSGGPADMSGGDLALLPPCTATDGFCITVAVPSTYAATPVKLLIGLYKTLGASGPAGPPDAIAAQIMTPTISAQMPLPVAASQLNLSGAYYLYVALYDQGGGMYMPAKGIDYVGESTGTITLGTQTPPNVGTLTLALAQ